MTKNLYELGVEYENAAAVVKERIAVRLKKLRVLRASGHMLGDEAYILKSEISRLYKEYYDALAISRHLKNYYSGHDLFEKEVMSA